MAGASMLVTVTHIDSTCGRQGPCLSFWGITNDPSSYFLLKESIHNVGENLEKENPPLNENELDGVFLILMNHKWERANLVKPSLSHAGTIEAICIDVGIKLTVPLSDVRTLNRSGTEADVTCPPLAKHFVLSDMVAAPGHESCSDWSEQDMKFLTNSFKHRSWIAIPMDMDHQHQGVRLLDWNYRLLVTDMIQKGLGVAAQSYQEALSMCETRENQTTFMKPAFNAFSIAVFKASRKYLTNDIPANGRHDVAITHIPDGPQEFYVQLKSEASDLLKLRTKLDCVISPALQGVPELGTTCIAKSPSDERFHRGLITAVGDYANRGTCTVFFADIGTREPVSIGLICEIPDYLLIPRLFAYRVSLFGVEDFIDLICLNNIFTSFVSSAPQLQVEVVEDDECKQKVNLYDNTGRSLREVLASIRANLAPTANATPVVRSNSLDLDKSAPACVTGNADSITREDATPVVRDSTPESENVAPAYVEIKERSLDRHELLSVTETHQSGFFFGQLLKIPDYCLLNMMAQLEDAYSSVRDRKSLYADNKSHVGHLGVVFWELEQTFYRVIVEKEFVSKVLVRFVDYGTIERMERRQIFSPFELLPAISCSPFGIRCRLDAEKLFSKPDWRTLLIEKRIHVSILNFFDGIFTVALTDAECNTEVRKEIISKKSMKEHAETPLSPTIPVGYRHFEQMDTSSSTEEKETKDGENQKPQKKRPKKTSKQRNAKRNKMMTNLEESGKILEAWPTLEERHRIKEQPPDDLSDLSEGLSDLDIGKSRKNGVLPRAEGEHPQS